MNFLPALLLLGLLMTYNFLITSPSAGVFKDL
jgi:hypothetical protein